MKYNLLIIFAICLSFAGCEKIKDATSITVSTKLEFSMPLSIFSVGLKSADLTSEATSLVFNKTQDLSIADNTDISPYLSKINEIKLGTTVVTVSGLTAGQTINTISLEVAGVGNIFTQTNITMVNNTFTPVIAAGVLDQVSEKLKTDKKITITVSGTASGPMTITVGVSIDTKVVVYTL